MGAEGQNNQNNNMGEQYGTLPCNRKPHWQITVQYSAVQYCTVQYVS